MSDQPYIPFSQAHGLTRVDVIEREWNGITVRYHEKHAGPGKAWGDMSSDKATVVVLIDQIGGYAESRRKLDQPTARTRYDAGFSVWVPPCVTIWGFSEEASLIRDVRLTFDLPRLAELLEDEFDHTRVHDPLVMMYDQRVTRLANLLADECLDPLGSERLYGESITTAFFSAFFSAWLRKPPSRNGTTLANWQLRIAQEYLEENFAREVDLATLAGMTRLSQSHFTRAFRASTGLPPYRYMLKVRLRRGQELLATTDLLISEIAIQIGFANQSHFTRAFRQLLGATPQRWRSEYKR